MSEWISVKERLPKINQKVFTFDIDYPEDGCLYEELINKDPVDWSQSYSVSHFLEIDLPEPPK